MLTFLGKKNFKRNLKWVLYACVVAAGLLFVLAGARSAQAQDLTQGYQSDQTLQNGMVVMLKPGSKTVVEPLSQNNETDVFGVVVPTSETPVSISDPNKTQVLVATHGDYDVLVSTQNGQILPGDSIVISSLEGVGMKADGNHQVIIGKALQGFADNANAESHVKLSDGQNVALGRISVTLDIARNPSYTGDVIAGVPAFLSHAAQSVSNKPVTAVRIYASIAIMFVCLAVAGAILYSGIRTGMNSIGRNPLARQSIIRNMVTVTLLALIVVSIGLFAVYLLLKI